MKKVILAQVTTPVQSANGTTSIFVPLGLGLLKAQAIKEGLCPEKFDIEILDRKKCLNYGDKRLLEYIISANPEIVGFSCYGWNVLRSYYLAKQIKKTLSECLIIFGGPEVGTQASQIMEQNAYIDIISEGEGEFSFVDILKYHIGKTKINEIDGIVYRDGKKVCVNKKRKRISNLDDIASPFLYDVFDLSEYDEVVFETMRGCPFSCSYCFYGGGESKLRFFSLERIREELLMIKRLGGPKSCEFTDSNFNLPQRLEQIYPVLKEINADHYFKFRAEINPEFVDEKQIEIFKELNILNIEVGIQSTNPSELKAIHRRFNEKKVRNTIKLLKKSGLDVNYHLIIGLPYQTKQSFIESNKFLIENGVGDRVNSFLLQVIPGTELRNKAEELGLIYSQNPPYFIQETKTLTRDDIASMIEYRSELIIEQQINKTEGERYLQNFELLRFNSYFNSDYKGLNNIRDIKVENDYNLKPILEDRVIGRLIFKEEFVNNDHNLEQLDGSLIGVFNQIVFEGDEFKLENIANILYMLFCENPYSCSDIVFKGKYVPSKQEIEKLFYILATVLNPFEYVEIERTRKRIEIIHLKEWDGKIRETEKDYVFEIQKVLLEDATDIEKLLLELKEKKIKAVLFDNSNVVDWRIIETQLEQIYKFNKENNYVFFENVKIQQYYIKNYVYGDTNARFSKYPFGYHDGEVTVIFNKDITNIKEVTKYPFER